MTYNGRLRVLSRVQKHSFNTCKFVTTKQENKRNYGHPTPLAHWALEDEFYVAGWDVKGASVFEKLEYH